MPTITDLFSVRIGFGKRGVFIEPTAGYVNLLIADEKFPLREGYAFSQHPQGSLEEILEKEGVGKESIYYVVPPSLYYRSVLSFPFHDRQKIDGVIKFEVRDYLPFDELEYVTDFHTLREGVNGAQTEVLSFSMEKPAVQSILAHFGRYGENLKAVVPFDVAVFAHVRSLIDKDPYVFVDVQKDALYVQHVKGGRIRHILYVKRTPDDDYRESLSAQLLLILKVSQCPSLYVNVRNSVEEEFRDLNHRLFEELGMSWRALPPADLPGLKPEHRGPEMISLLGTLSSLNQAPAQRVNLLKEEFKPRLRGYVRLKDFAIAGALLLALLVVSLTNLLMEVRFEKNRLLAIRGGIEELSRKVFGRPQLKGPDALRSLEELQNRIRSIERSIDRRYSSMSVLGEITTYLPQDVVIEFTDLIIEPGRVMLAGKAKTFSDIDRIKESLAVSDYVSGVEVKNTGTTGSTEGFAVTFVFDIAVKENLFGPEGQPEKPVK